ncbi:MAG: hypothetical protein ABIJ34_09420 [archaeon]
MIIKRKNIIHILYICSVFFLGFSGCVSAHKEGFASVTQQEVAFQVDDNFTFKIINNENGNIRINIDHFSTTLSLLLLDLFPYEFNFIDQEVQNIAMDIIASMKLNEDSIGLPAKILSIYSYDNIIQHKAWNYFAASLYDFSIENIIFSGTNDDGIDPEIESLVINTYNANKMLIQQFEESVLESFIVQYCNFADALVGFGFEYLLPLNNTNIYIGLPNELQASLAFSSSFENRSAIYYSIRMSDESVLFFHELIHVFFSNYPFNEMIYGHL